MGKPVRCRDGEAGRVIDMRVDTDTPPGAEVAELRLAGLVVSPRRWGSTVGYDRQDDRGPWLIWWIVHRLHRSDRYVGWDLVRSWADGMVQVDAAVGELPGVPALPPRAT